MTVSARPGSLGVAIVAALVLAAALAPTSPATTIRPKGASPIEVSLVNAFDPCFSPGHQHGPPLAFPSCHPPAQSSGAAVTVGEPTVNGAAPNLEGNIKLKAIVGTPGPPDDSDLAFQGSVSDVRCVTGTTPCGNVNTADGPDYTGGLAGNMIIRLSDRFNAAAPGGGTDPATQVDVPFPFYFTCANTTSAATGGQCGINTSLNTVIPLAVRDGKRTVIEVGQLILRDGGTDGNPNTSPNYEFLKQGVFIP